MGTECSANVSKGKEKKKLYSIFPVKVITIYRTKEKPPMPRGGGGGVTCLLDSPYIWLIVCNFFSPFFFSLSFFPFFFLSFNVVYVCRGGRGGGP